MRSRDVHLTEMLRLHPLRDPEIEEVLSGIVPENRPDLAEVAAFVADVSASAAQAAPPQLGPSLAAMLATGLTPTDKGDLPATAASNAHGPARQAAGLPNRRKQPMINALLESTIARIAGAAFAMTAGVGGLGVAGAFPGPIQDGFAHVAEVVGYDAPGGDEDQVPAPETEDVDEDEVPAPETEDVDEDEVEVDDTGASDVDEAEAEAAEALAEWNEAVAAAEKAQAEAEWNQALTGSSPEDPSDDDETADGTEDQEADEDDSDDVEFDEPEVEDDEDEVEADEPETDDEPDAEDHEDETEDQEAS